MADGTSKTPMTGGVSDKQTDGVFGTSGGEPVRDRTPDDSKGRPVTRFFTEDGTPVEPSSIPPAGAPYALRGPQPEVTRPDVVAAVEYVDEDGNTVTHDSAKAAKDSKDFAEETRKRGEEFARKNDTTAGIGGRPSASSKSSSK